MKRRDSAAISAGAAHALAWVVGFGFVVVPSYQSVSVTPVTPGGIASDPTRFTATLIEVNGLGIVLPLMLTPIVLTGLGLLAALLMDAGLARRKGLLWVSAVLLLGFCAVSIFSVGLFYLPAAAALIVSAVTGARRPLEDPSNGGASPPRLDEAG